MSLSCGPPALTCMPTCDAPSRSSCDRPHNMNFVQAYAAAVARAVAEVTLDCEVIGNGYACALGDADVRAVAKVFPSSPPADRL